MGIIYKMPAGTFPLFWPYFNAARTADSKLLLPPLLPQSLRIVVNFDNSAGSGVLGQKL